ncbi:MAG: gliding motility protein GldM [Bacteroidia bacterium]|jgi:gliding motility-associated protein GldM|nr:gliding motility protein GldM [Bacteroidia bacterium]
MASGKQTPRQKMIGMMYLVLTALLALNVSKEILDAFVTVNAGLENTGVGIDKDIRALYAEFDARKSVDPLRVQDNWEKAQQAKKLSKDINTYIDLLKKRLIRETEGFSNHEEDTIRLQFVDAKDNYDIPTNILIGPSEDGSNGEARILKQKLEAYENQLLSLLEPDTRKAMNLNIDTRDPVNEPELKTWELKTFYHSPLAASVALLSKIQDDVKSAESDVVDALLRETEADIIPFDTVAARIVAQSNYVLLDENYEADIFLAAFNKTLKPQIYIGDYDPATGKMRGAFDSVNVEQGIGKYLVHASSEGIKQYNGVINMRTPKGQMMRFPFQSEYIVARPALTVSAIKMNVMYAGLENPISVSVPGIPNEKLRVSIDNGVLTPKGNGEYMVTKTKPGTANIQVVAEIDGKVRNMGSMKFRVKPLPKPVARLSCLSSPAGTITKAQLIACPGIIPYYDPNFEFNANAKVVSFSVEQQSNGASSEVKCEGASIPQNVKQNFSRLRRGERVTFTNIKAMGADGNVVSLDDITYRVL